jgi:dihydrofolate reductase
VTEVSSEKIIIFFGGGLIKKKIPLSRVKEVKVVRNKWIYGWGIRYIINGWMWNIWGLDAVELTFNDKNAVFRIGSKNPEKLKEVIDKQLKKSINT